jgi:hypothetical protein
MFGGAKNEHERRRRENRGAEGGGVWEGGFPLPSGEGPCLSPENFLVFRIQTCIVVHILHRKIRNKLNISIGAGLKHHSMSWREMMM